MRRPDLRSAPYHLLRLLRLPPAMLWVASSLFSTHFLNGVFGIVSDERGHLLFFHHTYRAHRAWGLPGGWMKRSESPLATLEREIAEESGLVVRATRLLMVGTSPDRPKLEFVVSAHFVSGSFRPSPEVDAARWYAPDRLPPLPQVQYQILRQAAALAGGEIGWYENPWHGMK